MSNGLADASFFPTTKELSTGLRWFKDHPVLAAAAATAVSVITYLNATETLAHSHSSLSHLDTEEQDGGGEAEGGDGYGYGAGNGDGGAGAGLRSSSAMYSKREVGVVTTRRRVEVEVEESARGAKLTMVADSITKTATGLDSDEKLSAAVSWCDEHGGSLTQVFEELRIAGDERSEHENLVETKERHGVEDDVHSNRTHRNGGNVDPAAVISSSGAESEEARICDSNRRVGAALPPPRPFGSVIKKSSTQQSILSAMGASPSSSQNAMPSDRELFAAQLHRGDSPLLNSSSPGVGGDFDLQTESPQWGWYVAITPPQDHLYSNLPRATLQPYRAPLYPGSNTRATQSAFANPTLRRSTSGRIPS